MSLINQMLKDLEHRRSQDNPAEGLTSGGIHRYSAASHRGFPWWVVFTIISLLLALAVGYLLWDRYQQGPVTSHNQKRLDSSVNKLNVSPPVEKKVNKALLQKQPDKETLLVQTTNPPVVQTTQPQQLVIETPPGIETKISSIAPDPVQASSTRQQITINGEGFSQDTRITVAWSGNNKTLPKSQVKYISANQLRIQITVGTNADDWIVQAYDPEHGLSGEYDFRVVNESQTEDASAVKKVDKPLNLRQQGEVLYQQGYRLLAKGQSVDGEHKLLAALKLFPAHVKAREVLAGLYIKSGRVVEAADLLQEGLALLPRHVLFAKLQARLLLDQGKTRQAIEVLEKNVPALTAQPDYYAMLAAAYQRNNQHAMAVAKYRSVLKVNPRAGVWWIGLGISLEASGQQSEAQQAYEQARKTGTLTKELMAYADNRLKALKYRVTPMQKSGSE